MNTATRKLAEGCTIDDLFSALSRGREVFTLQAGEGNQYHLVRADTWDAQRHTLGAFRPIEPLKSVLFQPREFFGPSLENAETAQMRERIVIGVKNCDLAGLKIQDHVFLGLAPGDPRYIAAREKTILVACDCTDCLDVCFCPVLGEQPYAEEGYDINVSPLSQQYLIDSGNKRGEQLLEEVSDYLAPADAELLDERKERRAVMVRRLVEQVAADGLRPGMNWRAPFGARPTPACGGLCGGLRGVRRLQFCVLHLPLLPAGGWNRCRGRSGPGETMGLLPADEFCPSGGWRKSPSDRAARLRNRFQKKFDYFPEVLGCYACDGCGRCTEVCAGNIDIRAILKRASDELESIPADAGNH